MGVEWNPQAVIGFRFSLKGFTSEMVEKSCEHDHGGVKFCPECGKKVETFTRTVWGDEWELLRDDLLENLPKGYVFDDDNNYLYVGYGASVDREEAEFRPLLDPDVIRNTIIQHLEPVAHLLDINDLHPSKFGLWVTNLGH